METMAPGETKLSGAGRLLAAFTIPPVLMRGASRRGTPSAAERTIAAAAVTGRNRNARITGQEKVHAKTATVTLAIFASLRERLILPLHCDECTWRRRDAADGHHHGQISVR